MIGHAQAAIADDRHQHAVAPRHLVDLVLDRAGIGIDEDADGHFRWPPRFPGARSAALRNDLPPLPGPGLCGRALYDGAPACWRGPALRFSRALDRKSTRLNSSH